MVVSAPLPSCSLRSTTPTPTAPQVGAVAAARVRAVAAPQLHAAGGVGVGAVAAVGVVHRLKVRQRLVPPSRRVVATSPGFATEYAIEKTMGMLLSHGQIRFEKNWERWVRLVGV